MSIQTNVTLTRSILAAPSSPTLVTQITLQRAILAPGQIPTTQLQTDVTLTRRISANTIPLILNGAPSGLTGILTIEIETITGTVVLPETTAGIVEQPAASGRYVATVSEFAAGQYFVTWRYASQTAVANLTITDTGFLRVFRARKPPARTDSIPWTQVSAMESADHRRGPFLNVQTVTLTPVDEDPTDPAARDLTFTEAANADGWYSLQWEDADGHQHMTDPEYISSVIQTT